MASQMTAGGFAHRDFHAGVAASKEAIGAGALAGLIGGIAMAMVSMLHAWIAGMGFWLPVKLIAATWFGVDALIGGFGVIIAGMMTHMMVSIVWGALFGLFIGRRRTIGTALLVGLLYATAIWLVMTYVGLPLVNRTMLDRVHMQPAWWILEHWVYGMALLLAPPLARGFSHLPREVNQPEG